MTAWEISRHPEWDMMYAAGLTVREISEQCHRGVATIHAHFQARERYEPGTRARHEAALAARELDLPTPQWRARLDEAVEFLADNGRLPKASGSEAEISLHGWVARQRRSYWRGQMSRAKVFLLERLGGWKIDSHQESLDRQWEDKLAQLETYVNQHGQMPRYRTFASEDERSLGVWLHKQHQRRAEGKIAGWRHVALDEAVPGWRSRA